MLNRRMRGFGTILFDMVPKETPWGGERISRFGTILFDMVPKVESKREALARVLEPFCLTWCQSVTTLNAFSVFYFYQNMAYYYYE